MSMEPGWYPDPFSSGGYVRWWDGQRWGASTSVGATELVGGQPGAPVPLPPPMPPLSGRGPSADGREQAPFALATWGSRAVARIIDALIEGAITTPFVLWLIWPAMQRYLDAAPADGSAPSDAVMTAFRTDVLAVSWQFTLISAAVSFAYQVPQNVRWGRTVGKRILRIRIRPLAEDVPLSWGRATIRWATYTVGVTLTNGLFGLVDYLWPLWDRPWRQALHDKTARTVVVPTRQ